MTTLTREIAWAAAWDKADGSARANGRRAWTEAEQAVFASEFNRLWPEGLDKAKP